jgi:putative SOS response-associated peptidase YedK
MTLTATEPLLLAEVFGLAAPPPEAPRPRYNVAPTQDVLVIAGDGPRALRPMRWGLVPSWAKDLRIGASLINARADGVATKPSFRAAFKKRRCLVVVDGWYEWKTTASGKEPWRFRRADGLPFALAGLYETWANPAGGTVHSCAVITTEPNRFAAEIHDRMPVLLPREAFDRWLAPNVPPEGLDPAWLRPCPEEWITAERANARVGNPRNDDPGLLRA